ncbi:MAG TPA: NAD-binding protein [Acidobacteriota bacterium]|nr:NAD-binding protein [Acidobacteriota bacterium]
MKWMPPFLAGHLGTRRAQRDLKILLYFVGAFLVLIALYSVTFHYLMAWEGRDFSWLTGFYWTLTVMSTLGFGDITFESDVGRGFSMIVLLTGMLFLLVLLPFTFLEFFYLPWMQAQATERVPRSLPENTRGHVVLTHHGPIARALLGKLEHYRYSYVLVIADREEALRLHDEGINVVRGETDDSEFYRAIRVEQAAMVVSTGSDIFNTSAAFAVRDVSREVPIVATADNPMAAEVLRVSGATRVLELTQMMGEALARRTRGGDSVSQVFGQIGQVLIAEAVAAGTPLVGKTIAQSGIRQEAGVTVAGVWQRGNFEIARADTVIGSESVMVLAGSRAQLEAFDKLYRTQTASPPAPVIIIGGGRVGRAMVKALAKRGLDYRIVERVAGRVKESDRVILGDASNPEVLEQAGIVSAPAVIITTHDDDTNIYLAIHCRRIRPDVQLVSRVTLERNVRTLHRAGCDFVISYASMGAATAFNLLKRSDVLMVAEGLDVFSAPLPRALRGQTVGQTSIRQQTGCSIIAVNADGQTVINPSPDFVLPEEGELVLIGTVESETRFLNLHG